MTDSTRRALRTGYQTLIAALAAIGVLASFIPQIQATFPEIAALAVTVAGGAVAVSKVINALEDAGVIPAWLKAGAELSDESGEIEAAPEAPEDEGDVSDAIVAESEGA